MSGTMTPTYCSERETILQILPMNGFELHHLDPEDKDQLLSYMTVMYSSMAKRMDPAEYGAQDIGPSKTYQGPTGRTTSDTEALDIFLELRDEGLYEEGKGSELATELVEILKVRGLIGLKNWY